MTIQTYDQLVTAVENWLDRDDLADRIPEFIELLEGDLRRRLRVSVTREAITLNSAAVAMPAAAAEIRELRLNSGVTATSRPLSPLSPVQLAEMRVGVTPSARPRFYSVVGREILLVPVPDQSYAGEVIYFNGYVSVSDSVAGLIPTAPDLYLWGTLAMASMYLEHDERLPMWAERYEKALEDLNTQREREEFGQSLHTVRLPVVF